MYNIKRFINQKMKKFPLKFVMVSISLMILNYFLRIDEAT